MKPLADLLGDSPGMQEVRERLALLLGGQRDARRLPPVLIQGETGTGKGLLARMIHRAGPRAEGPFVDVNCAAIPETLLEAEMFGFERGAFTDARRAKPGLFQAAHRGTIFLDEVGLLPEAMQAKLLKVLEERVVRRLGSTRDEPVDVWIVTATNEDLKSAIRARRFREDLYHRLAVLTVPLPPLRERGRDILLLAEHFLARACADYGVAAKAFTADARAALRAHAWPGNVRELSNVVERAVLLSPAAEVTAALLDLGDTPPAPAGAEPAPSGVSLEDAMREHLVEVLGQTGGNISRTATLLGISRNTLRARMDRYGLRGERPAGAPPAAGPRPAAARIKTPPAAAAVPIVRAAPLSLRWERRRVMLLRTVVMAPTGPDAPLETSRIVELLLEKVETFGGTLEGVSPSGLVAVFGLASAEEAGTRAAHAALAIVKAAERARQEDDHEITVKLGLHVSEVLVGLGARGAELDMDDRRAVWPLLDGLVERADVNSILVTEPAAQLLKRRFEVARGDATNAGLFVLVGRERTGLGLGSRLAAFVGRHHELGLLRSRVELAVRGQGQVVGVVGEAGIGKSRLIYEFRQDLARDAVSQLTGHCQPYGTAMPYLAMTDVLRGVAGIGEADTPEIAAEALRRALADAGSDPGESIYLQHLLGIKTDEDRLTSLEPEAIKRRTFETLRELLLRRSRHRLLVLFLEDMHWIDRTSEEFFASLTDGIVAARILLVATYRAGYRPPWIDKSFATQIALRPLLPEEAVSIVEAALGAATPEPPLVQLILDKGEGNPFFLEELARALRDQGPEAGTVPVPGTVQDVLLARIHRLPPEDKRILQMAAVVGKDLPLSLLEALAATEADVLRQILARLQGAEFLYETTLGIEPAYSFKHALTHEVTYDSVMPETRRALHARIVALLGPRERPAEELAHHAFRGELWERAAGLLREAGARAAARSANREAVAYLEQALVALGRLTATRDTLAEILDVRVELKTALTPLGEHDRIFEHLREAESLVKAHGDRRRLGRVSAYLSDHFRLVGDHARAIEYGHQALAVAEELDDFSLKVPTHTYLGLVYRHRGDYRRAIAFFRRNVESLVGDLVGDRFDMAQLPAVHSRAWMASCLSELGEFTPAIALAEEGLRIADAVKHPVSRVVAHFGVGDACLRRGDLRRAIPVLRQGLSLSREWNVRFWSPRIAAALGAALALAGEVEEALPLAESAVERYTAVRQFGGHAQVLTSLGEIYVAAGRLQDAARLAARALELASGNAERGHEAWALRLLGAIAAQSEPPDVERAEGHDRRGLALAEELGMRPAVAHFHLALGRLCASARRSEAHASLTTAREMFDAMGMLGGGEAARRELTKLG